MEHTPGPWKARIWKDGDAHQGNRIEAADGFEVANLSYTGAQEDQDATLIAEAPNMLDALREIARNCETFAKVDNMAGRLHEIATRATEAATS